MNIGVVSLGCAKNQVDLEEILSYLKRNGFETTSDPELSDIIIVNTCGFIDAAKKESIDAILDMIQFNKPVVVTGCLSTRYVTELKKEIPEVALWVSLNQYKDFSKLFQPLVKDRTLVGEIDPTKRVFISPSREAYLRISDGCNNYCTFCAIPYIRGRFKSVPLDTLKEELDMMDSNDIRSLTVISQDTSMYGRDFNDGTSLVTLTKEIVKHKSLDFIKLMYLYPDEVEDELIDLFANESNLTPYFDLPIQHFSDHVLRKMGRRGSQEDIIKLINKFRSKVPEAILRTTIMVGFPGETDEDFNECLKLIQEVKFDYLGCFMFCPEEGTPAYKMKDQVDEKVKLERYNRLMKEQKKISYKLNKARIGKTYKCLITKYNEEEFCYDCICNIYAPDDIDGKMRVYSKIDVKPGDLVLVKVVNALFYDLDAEVVEVIRKV